jgi:predicted nucleic-acid-binding protein
MRMAGGSLDTNVVLRLLLRDDEQKYGLAKKLISSESTFHIADISLAEIAFVLDRYYELSRADIKLVLENLLYIDNLNFNRELLAQSLDYFIDHPKLSLEDCMLSIYAKLNQAEPLYTFDKKLANQMDNTEYLN